MTIIELLKISIQKKASDIHLSENRQPILRIDGQLISLNEHNLIIHSLSDFIREILTEHQIKQFNQQCEFDFALSIAEIGRLRVNSFRQNNGHSAAIRLINPELLSVQDLGIYETVKQITALPHGLVLITGVAGSGKSTTLATIINTINHQDAKHIITIEDPIEFVHISHKSLIHQREIHRDTTSFKTALRAALREDPNIILLGELRDLDTIRLALTAAETGHLVFATLHTASAAKSINRIIDIFPTGDKQFIRSMLSESLQAVISQTLVNKIGGGRVAACEILFATPAIRNLIREDKITQINTVIQTNTALGMQTIDQHLKALIARNVISKEIARDAAVNKDLFPCL